MISLYNEGTFEHTLGTAPGCKFRNISTLSLFILLNFVITFLGKLCTHVGAVLFYVEYAVRLRNYKTCIEEKAY